jgi:hypothetical protein
VNPEKYLNNLQFGIGWSIELNDLSHLLYNILFSVRLVSMHNLPRLIIRCNLWLMNVMGMKLLSHMHLLKLFLLSPHVMVLSMQVQIANAAYNLMLMKLLYILYIPTIPETMQL